MRAQRFKGRGATRRLDGRRCRRRVGQQPVRVQVFDKVVDFQFWRGGQGLELALPGLPGLRVVLVRVTTQRVGIEL